MAEGMNPEEVKGPEPGRVDRVCREMLVHADAGLAYHLQNEEFDYKYGLNRFNRRTARGDIPVAKLVQNEEEERLQRERMEFLERQKRLADADEEMAKQIMDQLSIEEQQELRRQELTDAEIAKKLQEKEQQRYERKLRERELAKERKRLERQLAEQTQDAQEMLADYRREGSSDRVAGASREQAGSDGKLLRSDNRVEDVGDFSDFYIQPDPRMNPNQKKELQELQDEELARILQDQEHKRGATVNKTQNPEIEAKDAELARIIQEQEKLKARKHRQHKHERHERHDRHRHHSHPERNREPEVPPPLPSRPRQSSQGEQKRGPVFYSAGDEISTRVQPHLQGQVEARTRSPEERWQRSGAESPDRHKSSHPHQPASPAPPGYETRHNGHDHQRSPQPLSPGSTSTTSSGGVSTTNNILTAIDPTYQPDRDQASMRSQQPAKLARDPSLTLDMPRRIPSTGLGTEDGYADLDDFAPVPGQRRSAQKSRKKSSKKDKSCKQQ